MEDVQRLIENIRQRRGTNTVVAFEPVAACRDEPLSANMFTFQGTGEGKIFSGNLLPMQCIYRLALQKGT